MNLQVCYSAQVVTQSEKRKTRSDLSSLPLASSKSFDDDDLGCQDTVRIAEQWAMLRVTRHQEMIKHSARCLSRLLRVCLIGQSPLGTCAGAGVYLNRARLRSYSHDVPAGETIVSTLSQKIRSREN